MHVPGQCETVLLLLLFGCSTLLKPREAGAALVASDLKGVDEAGSADGLRQDRVSNSLENLVKAKAFVHFLQTGEGQKKKEKIRTKMCSDRCHGQNRQKTRRKTTVRADTTYVANTRGQQRSSQSVLIRSRVLSV